MQAKEFLSRARVEFETIELADLDDPMATLRAVTGGHVGTPVVVIDGAFMIGFDPAWIEARLVERN